MSGTRSVTPNSGGQAPANVQQQNAMARAIVLSQSANMIQSIASGTIANPGSSANIINVSPRLVGLAKRFMVKIVATIQNTDAVNDLTLTGLGPANILSAVQFNDLSNNIRIQTAGWHLHMVSSAKRQGCFGASYVNDSPIDFGSNFNVISAPQSIPAGGANTGTVTMWYEVPLSYSDTDLRGALYLNVTNATATLQLTINPAPVIAAGSDATLGVYSGGTGVITSLTYNVYQNYLDQLPQGANGVILPINDIATVYLLNNTTQQGIVANQDFPVPYANFRDFLSTFAIFDNGGTLNVGSDVNYWALQAANYINFFKIEPTLSALMSRNLISSDWPPGMYYFSHRDKPLSTVQYGNQELVLNASTVNANAKLFMAYEQFSLIGVVGQAGSLAIA